MKIALLGYGKMGKEIEQIAVQRGHEIALRIGEKTTPSLTPLDLKTVDAAIEFSTPASAPDNIRLCFQAHVPVVCGTTGWLEQEESIRQECRNSGNAFFYASNYSVGVNLFFQLNKYLARIMNNYGDYEPELEEIHHIHKIDAPSGTGITLAQGIISEFNRKKTWKEGKSTDPTVLGIHSIREGEVPGTHTITYHSPVDDIQITHRAHNRKGFALGAVLAAEWIQGKKGVFGMNDMLGFTQ